MEIVDKNYHNCTISKGKVSGSFHTMYLVKHSVTNLELRLLGFAEALRAAKLLDLEYIITEWVNFK